MDEVHSSSRQQTDGIGQIASAVGHMDQAAQTTVASAEESASQAEALRHQSEKVFEIADHLRALVGSTR